MTTSVKDLEKIIIIDLGSTTNQQITRVIREEKVYSEILASDTTAEAVKAEGNVIGLILSGGSQETAKDFDPSILDLDLPILAFESATWSLIEAYGGQVNREKVAYFEDMEMIQEVQANALMDQEAMEVWVKSQAQEVTLGDNLEVLAEAKGVPVIIGHSSKDHYALQFHPEADQSVDGKRILHNFLYDICDASGNWSMSQFIDIEVDHIRQVVGDQKVLLALSGGVDSSVVGVLLHQAIGDQLTCIFVDHGLLRKNEAEEVMDSLAGKFGLDIHLINAQDRFLDKLAGEADPEVKRKIIGKEFIEVFADEADKLDGVEFLAQGTLYSDVIESGFSNAPMVKSHHNVGGLPEDMSFKLIEPLATLFKDEVRELGTELGMPDSIVWRQPFPGPGLGVRVLGEITRDKLVVLREADYVLRREIAASGLDREIWQYFAVLPGIQSVGMTDGQRTFDYTIGIRAVHSSDGMTSDFAKIPWEVLEKISQAITSEVKHVNRVVYDITAKPPATIEWE